MIRFFIKTICFFCKLIYNICCFALKNTVFIIKLPFYCLYPFLWFAQKIVHIFSRKPKKIAPLPVFDNKEIEELEIPRKAKIKKSISKIGSLVPVEEDHELRAFTVMNSEGELFLVDTSVKGTFYGSVWTKVLSSYEQQLCLRGRIVRHYFDDTLAQQGFEVRISNIKAFLPFSESMRIKEQRPINVPIAVTHIYPETNLVIVSSKIAYQRLIGHQIPPAQGNKSQMIYWDYDEHHLYCLLPDRYMGIADREETSIMKTEELMGTTASCNIDSVSTEARETQITVLTDSVSLQTDVEWECPIE